MGASGNHTKRRVWKDAIVGIVAKGGTRIGTLQGKEDGEQKDFRATGQMLCFYWTVHGGGHEKPERTKRKPLKEKTQEKRER